MSLVPETIVLEVDAEFSVLNYSSAGIQVDTVLNSDGAEIKFIGTIDDVNWMPARVRLQGREDWGSAIRVNTGDVIELDLGYFKTIKVESVTDNEIIDAVANWQSRSFNPTHLIAAADEADIRAAIEFVHSQGGGTVDILAGTAVLTAPLPIYDGVRVRGATLGMLTFTTIPDSFWNFDTGNVTLLVGDGTFNAFQHNHVGTGTLPTDQTVFANEMVTNFAIEGIAFDNFTSAVHIGSQNRGGGFFFHLRDLLIKNTTVWGIRVTNSMHYEIERIHIVNSWQGGAALFEGDCPDSILQTGNCWLRHLFACPMGDGTGSTAKQRRLARGVEFRASHSGGGTGILNEYHAYGVQVNMFQRTGLSATATFTSGNANIGVPDGTEYTVGMVVRFTSTPATGFVTNRAYVVRSVVGNNIQLALDRSSAVITPSSSTTATMLTNGMPGMMVYGDTATSRVNNSDFTALDLEGGYGAGLYLDRPGTSIFSVNQFGSLANNIDIVARGASNCSISSLNTAVTDIDGTSSASYFTGRQTMLDRPGKGMSYETALGGHIFSMGGSGISAIRVTSGDGFRMVTNAAFGLQVVSRTASLTMGNQHFGHIVLSGTTSGQNITLPSASNSTGETGNGGCIAVITNASNQSWTIQTTGGQLFNGVAAKTSFVLPAGQMALALSTATGYGAGMFGALP